MTTFDRETASCLSHMSERETTLRERQEWQAGRNSVRKSMGLASLALTQILNQPFDGDWDQQALFVQNIIKELKLRGDWMEPNG